MKEVEKKLFDAYARLELAKQYGDAKIIAKIEEEINKLKSQKEKEK